MILYALVARGSLVISEYSEAEEDYSQLLRKTLIKVKKSDEK